MEAVSDGTSPCFPLSSLRLLIPPIRLLSAAAWQTIQHKVVADYGILEEFVSMVTEFVPELLTRRQRAQLILGLRARLILELCHFEATANFEVVQPHLERMHSLTETWAMEAGIKNVEVPNVIFVDLVKDILKNHNKREQFFQDVFPKEFGSMFDEALHSLMLLLLSRLEKFLPLQTFLQVATVLCEVSSVFHDSMKSVSQCEELNTLLHYGKDLRHLDLNDGSLDCVCIMSALKLPSAERIDTQKTQVQNILDDLLLCKSDLEKEFLTSSHTTKTDTDHQTSEKKSDCTPATNGPEKLFRYATEHEETVGLLHSQAEDVSNRIKQCHVYVEKLEMPLCSQTRPVRRNRGLRLKKILLKVKRGFLEESPPPSKKTEMSKWASTEFCDNEDVSRLNKDSYMAPISNCSDSDSWSYYSDNGTSHETAPIADSWSNYSGDASSDVFSSSSEDNLLPSCLNEETSLICPKTVPATSRKPSISDIKACTPKKTRKVQCFICKEHVNTSLRTHMKAHFPTGDYACPRCDSRFKLFTSFKMHLHRTCYEYQQLVDREKPKETKNLYRCDKCQEGFRYKISLDKHKLTHNELYCSVCRKVLRNAETLERHKVSHTLFHCTRCEETFTLFLPLLRHCENIHKISTPFKCSYCPKTSSKLRLLIMHEWRHTGHLPFQCAQCSCRFRSDSDLIYHKRVHTKEKPYLCSECGKTFSLKSNLLRHLNLIHSESRNEKKHSCSQCEKSFKEKGSLKKHQRSKHLSELFRHLCPYCGKMVSATTLARHKLIHTGKRPYKCIIPECDKYFRSTSEVKRHALLHHTTERPYKCDVCGKGFIKMCFLNTHARIHSGEKPFVCHICGKAFSNHYSMQRHKNLVHIFVKQ